MQSISGLVARLERAAVPDRRLDAEIIGCVLAPQGWVINPFQAPDGWDIELAGGDGVSWSPEVGQVVKVGSTERKDGPDDGKAEAVFG